MHETAQASAARKSVRELGGQLRLGGLFFTVAATYNALTSLPVTKPEIMANAGLITLGTHMMGRMARDCFMAADYARDPIRSARQSLKYPPILSNLFMFVIASSGLSSIAEATREAVPEPLAETALPVGNAKQITIERRSDANCARGKSVITFDKDANSATIVECTGP